MHRLKVLTSLLLIVTTPTTLLYPQYSSPQSTFQLQKINYEEQRTEQDYIFSYDDMLHLFDKIESGDLEEKCTSEELEKIKHFVAFLAKEGALADGSEESFSLDNDIEELLNGEDNIYADTLSCLAPDTYQYMLMPAVLHEYGEILLCKSWIKKRWTHVRNFVKKHKKALLIGGAVAVGGAAAVMAATAIAQAIAGAAAAGAAGKAAAPNPNHKSDKRDLQENTPSMVIPNDLSPGTAATHEAPILKSNIDNQIAAFKEQIVQNQFFQTSNPEGYQGLSWQENGRILGSLFAHNSYNTLQNQLPYDTRLAQEIQEINSKYTFSTPGWEQCALMGHSEIDRKFSTDYGHLYLNPTQEIDFNTLAHQVRGERALSLGYYNQAVQDLGKAIETNPSNPIPYLERGIAHFDLGEYDRSLEDYHQFTSQSQAQKSDALSLSEFSLGFAKGLPKGVYESGEGLFLFMSDFVKHPIQTSQQIVDSMSTLVDLVRKDEWEVVAEVLSPEVHQLVTQWETLPSEHTGELAGYAVGKHGADILVPGALARVASKSVKSAQELAVVCKNLQIAQETLVLETAAGIGDSAKIAEVVRSGQTMAFLGEELGFNAREMGQLKQAGKLERAIDSAFENLINKPGYEVLKTAIDEEKHVKFIRDYFDKPTKELRKSVKSLEKLIAEHQDKITNPSQFIPHWETLHLERQHALINKKWPTEIQCYTEQKDILQNILNQRIEK